MENALPRTICDVFPAHLLSCFKYETLTRVQQHVLPSAYKERSNMMVCAPTGSGKTAVFEAAFLQEYERSRGDSTAKALYIAPVKALLQERLCDWRNRFGNASIGINFLELSGDTRIINVAELEEAHVLLSTPEKWDAITRNIGLKGRIVFTINTLFVDEVHHIGDKTRGATLEAVMCRMMNIAKSEQHKSLPAPVADIRIIAVSATFSNAEVVARWIKCPNKGLFQFGPKYRPVPLKCVTVQCGGAVNGYLVDRAMDARIPEIIQQHSNGKPTLVVCSSRSSSVRLAGFLSAELRRDAAFDISNRRRKFYLDSLQDNRPKEQVMNALLRGVGFHHAGLSPSERALVESLFRDNLLPVLCCTSALAVGVNLPAHLVVVKGTRHYHGSKGCASYPNSQILQMIGRAGRPGYDNSGTAVIVTGVGEAERVGKLLSDTESTHIHSQLAESLPLIVNSEVARNQISNREDAITWMQTTLLWEQLRLKSNGDSSELLITKAIDSLIEAHMIAESSSGDIRSTPAGASMSQGCIQMDSMEKIVELKGSSMSISGLLLALSMCKELRTPFRRQERSVMNRLKDSSIRYILPEYIDSETAKVSYLIQAALSKVTLLDDNLLEEQGYILKESERLLGVAIDYFKRMEDGVALHAAYRLWRCVSLGCWDDPSGKMSLYQVPGLDLPTAATLEYIGISTVRQLSQAAPEKIDSFLRRNPPIGSKLVGACRTLKTFELSSSWTEQSFKSKLRLNVSVTTNHPNREGAVTLLIWTEDKLIHYIPNITEDYCFQVDLPAGHGKIVHARAFHHTVCGLDSRLRIEPPSTKRVHKDKNTQHTPISPGKSSYHNYEVEPSTILTSILKLEKLHSVVKQQPISKYMRKVKRQDPDRPKPIPTQLPTSKKLQQDREVLQRKPSQKRRSENNEADGQTFRKITLFDKYRFHRKEPYIDSQPPHKHIHLGNDRADATQCWGHVTQVNTATHRPSVIRTLTESRNQSYPKEVLHALAHYSGTCSRDTPFTTAPNLLSNTVQLKCPAPPVEAQSHVIENEIDVVDSDEAFSSIFF